MEPRDKIKKPVVKEQLDMEQPIELVPRKKYRPVMKRAMDRLAEFDDAADLAQMLFKREELEWLQTEYKRRKDA